MSASKRRNNVECSSSSAKRGRGVASCVSFDDDDFNDTKNELPAGPKNYGELSYWPRNLLSSACAASQPAVVRMREFVRYGLNNNSDYSGYDCPREMLTQVWKEMTYCDFFQMQTIPSLNFTRACDNADLPLAALRYWAEVVDGSQSCLNTDIEGVLTRRAAQHLDKLELDANKLAAKLETKIDKMKVMTECFSNMQSWLFDNRHIAFTEDFSSPCLIHECACALSQPRAEDDKSLSINWAGTTCTCWSTVGKRETFAHGSERTHAVWLTTRVCQAEAQREDGFMQECTRFYAVQQKLVKPVERWFFVVSIKVCGTFLGYPSKRLRSLAFGGYRGSLVWCGPQTPEEVQKEFERLFYKKTVAT